MYGLYGKYQTLMPTCDSILSSMNKIIITIVICFTSILANAHNDYWKFKQEIDSIREVAKHSPYTYKIDSDSIIVYLDSNSKVTEYYRYSGKNYDTVLSLGFLPNQRLKYITVGCFNKNFSEGEYLYKCVFVKNKAIVNEYKRYFSGDGETHLLWNRHKPIGRSKIQTKSYYVNLNNDKKPQLINKDVAYHEFTLEYFLITMGYHYW